MPLLQSQSLITPPKCCLFSPKNLAMIIHGIKYSQIVTRDYVSGAMENNYCIRLWRIRTKRRIGK